MNEQLVQSLLHEIVRLNYNLQILIEQNENNNVSEIVDILKRFDEYGVGTLR